MVGPKKMSTMDEKVDLFSAAFEKIALTLIAKLAEIDDTLARIASDTELLSKIKIQLAENIKLSSAIERHINALNSRLDKMGFEALGGIPATVVSQPLPLTATPKPGTSNSTSEESLFSMPAPASQGEKDGALKVDLNGLTLPPAEELLSKQGKGTNPTPAKASQLTPLPEMPKPKGAKAKSKVPAPEAPVKLSPVPEKPVPHVAAVPEKPVPHVAANSNLPFLEIKNAENAAFVLIQNLSKEVNELGTSEEIGRAFLRTKDQITAQIKFHPALFELIKFGNDYIRKKPTVNNEFRKEVQKKIEELYRKFGGV